MHTHQPHDQFGPHHPSYGEPKRLPHHIEREKVRQQSYMPPDDDIEERMSIKTAYDALWPFAFWVFTLLLIGVMGKTAFSLITTYNWVDHLQVTIISIGGVSSMIVIYKWIILGPDGLPWRKDRQ